MCLLLLNVIILTNCQVIHDQPDKCNSNVDNDLLLKVRELQSELSTYHKQSVELKLELSEYREQSVELQLEFSAYREQAMKTERRLEDKLTQLKEEFAQYRSESMDKQTALEDELKRQGNQFICDSFNHYAHIILSGI